MKKLKNKFTNFTKFTTLAILILSSCHLHHPQRVIHRERISEPVVMEWGDTMYIYYQGWDTILIK